MTFEEFYDICDSIVPDKYGCMNWPRYFGYYPRANIDGVNYQLSRFILMRKLGRPITPGLFALHKCDNRRCIASYHIYEGTQIDNARDAGKNNPWILSDPKLAQRRLDKVPRWYLVRPEPAQAPSAA